MLKRVVTTVAALVLILGLGIGTVWRSGCCATYPDPQGCDALRVMAEKTPSVVPEMEWRGCPDVPWDRMSSFTPPPRPSTPAEATP